MVLLRLNEVTTTVHPALRVDDVLLCGGIAGISSIAVTDQSSAELFVQYLLDMGSASTVRVSEHHFIGIAVYLTAEGVKNDPNGGWFQSGDLGEVTEDGELRVVGRSKDVIIRSGHNIDPQMIEDVALEHPDVSQSAAVGMPDDYAGEVPVLYVVTRPEATVSVGELANFISARIAEPPARPKLVFLLDELPLTPFAKVARFRLRQLAVEHRANELVTGLLDGVWVTCTDPAAKKVHIADSTVIWPPIP